MSKAPKPTRESMLIAAAIRDSGMSKAAIATHLGCEPANVSHWATARRPVPARFAGPLAELLGRRPEEISTAYAEVAASGAAAAPVLEENGVRGDLEIARLQNDIHALNLALGAMVVAMARHRPAEAKDVSAAIRKQVPKKFRERGLIHELLKTMDVA